MKIRFCSDNDLPLRKTLDLFDVIIVIRSVFYDDGKCFPQFFLNNFLLKLAELV